MRFIAFLLALPEILLIAVTCIEPLGTIVFVEERRNKLGDLRCFCATLQHGTHHGGQFFIPAIIAHCPPAAIAVNFHSPRTAIKTSGQPDCPHLCRKDVERVKVQKFLINQNSFHLRTSENSFLKQFQNMDKFYGGQSMWQSGSTELLELITIPTTLIDCLRGL